MQVQPEDTFDQASSSHLRADSSRVIFPSICGFDAETVPPLVPYHYDFGASGGTRAFRSDTARETYLSDRTVLKDGRSGGIEYERRRHGQTYRHYNG